MKLVAVFLVASAVAGVKRIPYGLNKSANFNKFILFRQASLAAPKLHESAIDDGSKADENRSESASLLDIAPLLVKMNASPRDFDWQSAAKYLADQVRFLVNIVDTLAAENGFSNDWEPVKEKISAILSELENCRNEKYVDSVADANWNDELILNVEIPGASSSNS